MEGWVGGDCVFVFLVVSSTLPPIRHIQFFTYDETPVKRMPCFSWQTAECTLHEVQLSLREPPKHKSNCHYSPRRKRNWFPVLFRLQKRKMFRAYKAAVSDNTKTATKFCNNVSKDIYFFYYVMINACTQEVFENVLFTNDKWATS